VKKFNFKGRLRNITLKPSNSFLPIYEAIINSIQAIENRGNNDGSIKIIFERITDGNLSLFDKSINQNLIKNIIISDNGIGFNEENFNSFNTSDSDYKKSIGGKGIGRLIWLKAFEFVTISSHYSEEKIFYKRIFKFIPEIGISNEELIKNNENKKHFTEIKLNNFIEKYQKNFPTNLETIAQNIIEHILLYYISNNNPNIVLYDSDNDNSINLSEYYNNNIKGKYKKHGFNIKNEFFQINLFKIYRSNRDSKIVFCARNREVITFKIKKYIDDLSSKISDEEGKYALFVYVTSNYFDNNINQEGTEIYIDEDDSFFVTKQEIILEIIKYLKNNILAEYLNEIKEEKIDITKNFITNDAPQYRYLLSQYPDEIDKIPYKSIKNKNELNLELFKIESKISWDLKEKGNKILEALPDNKDDLKQYREEIKKFIEKENEVGKANLAKYVEHRNVILKILQKHMRLNDDEKYSLEEAIHELIFPLKKSSDDIGYKKHNLWIIDEKLSYHKYLMSDKKLNTYPEDLIDTDSGDQPDIAVFNSFDNPISLIENDTKPFSSVVIFEFKRPMRNYYQEQYNPIIQIKRYMETIRKGDFKDKDGILIPPEVIKNTPFYAYVICSLVSNVREYLENDDFTKTPDALGFFKYYFNNNFYIEVLSYDKLLQDAKQRNKSLFDELNLPSFF